MSEIKNKDTEVIKPLEETVEAKPVVKNSSARWYVVQVHSGCENSVVASIKEKAEKVGMMDKFEDMLVPTHTVSEVKKGKKVESERKFFPRYVLVKMVMNNDTWSLVRNINRVLGFLGTRTKPIPVSEKEAMDLIGRLENPEETVSASVTYEIGEQVKVCDGPFASFNGSVEEVDTERNRLKVSVSIFGRPTEVELEFRQVEKI